MARTVKKFADRRAEIVETARNLFITKEYEKTTMQDIMAVLGIAKGTIYHYFKSKEDLLEAVVEEMVERATENMQAIVKEAKGNALEKMEQLIKAGNIAIDQPELLEQLHKPANSAMHVRLLAAALSKQAPLYAKLIEQGCSEGIFKTKAPLESAEFILSGIQFLTDVGIHPWAENDLKRRIKAFPRLIEQQLQAPKGSFQFLEGLM